MKHTQGEWKIVDNMNIDSEKGLSIATVFWNSLPHHTTMVPKEEGEANIKLIAAAPEMLEAMQLFVDRVDAGEVRSKKTYNSFKAIIKKATE